MAEKENKKKAKSKLKTFNPEKYINLKPVMNEARKKTIVLSFGRLNPITIGHEKLINKIISEAASRKADAAMYMSHTQDKKKNPLSYDQKIEYASKAFGKVIRRSNAKNLIEVAKELTGKYDEMIVVVGSDRMQEFQTLLDKYNGKEFRFQNVEVISAGDRDPDADDASGMSASKLRDIAVQGDFNEFRKGLPKRLQTIAKEVYDAVRKGMGLSEEFEEETLEETALTFSQRRKRGLQMKRIKSRLRIAREKAKRRMADKEKLQIRSRRKARQILRNRLSKKSYSKMSPSEKIALDTRLAKIPQSTIDRIARKQLPSVRRAEMERLHRELNPSAVPSKNEAFEEFYENYYAGLSKSTADKRRAHFEKGKRMDDNNPAAYKPAPGDARAETKPSYHTKKYHQIFTKEGKVKFDRRFKMYREKINPYFQESAELEENLLESIFDLQESVENLFESNPKEALKKKASETGISYGVLKKVFDRGVAAWRTGHRPGTTPTQWGLARVNSFATKSKGTWGKADSDLAAKVRKEEIELDSFFDLNERFELLEASILDKALAAIHKHVLAGDDVMDIIWNISRAKGVNSSSRELYNKYVEKYGNPEKPKSISMSSAALKKKYGFNEQEHVARTKLAIAREKQADKEKHKRMVDIAKRRDAAMKEDLDEASTAVKPFVKVGQSDFAPKVSKHIKHHLGIGVPMKHMVGDAIKSVDIDNDGDVDKFEKRTPDEITGTEKKNMTKVMQKKLAGELKHTKVGHAFESIDKSKPENREYGTDSLVKILKSDTPGQDLKEYALNAPLIKGDRVRFQRNTITGVSETIEGTIVGTETYSHEGASSVNSSMGRLRVRDDSGKLYLVRHEDIDLIESTISGGFEGKKIVVKNEPTRMIDGSIRKMPPAKSSSSKGGNGD